MRRYLFVIHYPVFGGPHNQALRLAPALRDRDWDTVVLLPDEAGTARDRLTGGGVEVVTARLHRLRAVPDPRAQLRFAAGFAGDVARIRRAIRASSAELVLIGGLVNPQAAVAARLEGVPVVWQVLDTRPPPALRRVLLPLLRGLADVVMTTGTRVAALHPGLPGLGERLVPFFPPVDVELFRPDADRRARARAELGLDGTDAVVGTVGNLTPMKGHSLFLRAAARLLETHPATRFAILGADYGYRAWYGERLRSEAAALGLTPDRELVIRDPGERVAELAQALDVFWLTSEPRSEGVPTSIGEAMALELPVVATDVAGVRDAVVDGVTGFVVAPGDAAALADATGRLLGDPSLRQPIGAAARARAVELFGIERSADAHAHAFALAAERRTVARAARLEGTPPASGPAPVAYVCPTCGHPLEHRGSLHCVPCDRSYPVVDGIPVLLAADARADDTHKLGQAEYFDSVDAEFEISRPHGTPALYRWLLGEKFRRSVSSLRPLAGGSTALTVCGGSGMDAEFLARTGARVVVADLSLEAVRRALERARRQGLSLGGVVADVERLPFADRSFDLVYVHDGLHHLEDPLVGLAEMSRVARRAVSVNEPADARVTALAVRVGFAYEVEDAGNPVARVDPSAIVSSLESSGFRIVACRRYGMYYRHEPGSVFRLLSRQPLLAAAQLAVGAFNRVAGGVGNKLTVQAVREPTEGVD